MICQACRGASSGAICPSCAATLAPAPDRLLAQGVPLIAAFEHVGSARTLVHHLKYRGLTAFADLAALRLSGRVPSLPIVPVPRAMTRRLRYGVDPAFEIARRLAALVDSEVLHLLRAPAHSPRRAGGDHRRPAGNLSLRRRFSGSIVLVDDVVTTGTTLNAAIGAIGAKNVSMAVSGNASLEVSSPSI